MENENKKYYLSEFSYDDGEYEITFNIIDVNFEYETITVAITRAGKITQDTFPLLRDKDGKRRFLLYCESTTFSLSTPDRSKLTVFYTT